LQLQKRLNLGGKTTILKPFLKEIFKGKSSTPKCRKICCQSTIRNLHAAPLQYDLGLPAAKTILLRTLPQQRGTLTQPFHCDLQTRGCKHSVHKEEKKSSGGFSCIARKSGQIRRQSDDARTSRATEPAFLRN
jgi:hypothetical protein